MQKRAIRIATGSHYIAHTEPLFKLYYKLNVKDLYHLKTLRLLFTRQVYAESCLKFQLVKVLNDTDKSILQMIQNQTHSYISFSNNVTRSFINKYNPECDVVDCYVCRIASVSKAV